MTKTELLTVVDGLPDSFGLDEVVQKLILIEKINEALETCGKAGLIRTSRQ